jgi:hypothetical protein
MLGYMAEKRNVNVEDVARDKGKWPKLSNSLKPLKKFIQYLFLVYLYVFDTLL